MHRRSDLCFPALILSFAFGGGQTASALTKEEALENCRVTAHQDGRFGTGRNLSAAQSQSDTGSENQRFAWLANRLCCQRPVLGSRRLASPCDYFRGARTVR